VSGLLFAGETGTIGGTVTNEYGDPVMGANVRVLGVDRMAVVGHGSGSYEVSQMPAGIFSVLYTGMGFDSLLVTDVPIAADSVTSVSVILNWRPSGQRIDTVSYLGEVEVPTESTETIEGGDTLDGEKVPADDVNEMDRGQPSDR